MRKTLVAILAVSAIFLAPALENCIAGTDGGHIEPYDGGYELGERFISFFFSGDTAVSITDVEVKYGTGEPTTYSVFEQISIEDFHPTGAPTYDEMIYSLGGQHGIAKAHDTPMGVMVFETYVDNRVDFRISNEMGAISSERSVIIGKDNFRADLVLLGSGNLTKAGQDISIEMRPGDRFFFRTSYVYEGSIGNEISEGKIAGELYLDVVNQSLAEAVVAYLPIEMGVQFSSTSKVEVAVDASFEEGKSIIFTLDRSAFDVPIEQLNVRLDGTPLREEERVEDVLFSSEETYYALQNEEATQVFIHIPNFSKRMITLSKIGPREVGTDVILGALASFLLVVAAGVFLFRRRD